MSLFDDLTSDTLGVIADNFDGDVHDQMKSAALTIAEALEEDVAERATVLDMVGLLPPHLRAAWGVAEPIVRNGGRGVPAKA